MTKGEALQAIISEGSLNFQRKTPAWEQAFKLYNETHRQDQKTMSCGSCFRAVKNWLQS